MSDDSDPEPDPGLDRSEPSVEQRGALPGVVDHWPALRADVEATAAEYRDRGWEVLEVHPGDVVALGPGDHDRWGLDVLAPDDELDAVARAVETGRFDETDVFRTTEDDLVFLLVVARDDPTRQVVLVPAYYRLSDADAMMARARERGVLPVHLRPLSGAPVVTFSHERPGLFFPD